MNLPQATEKSGSQVWVAPLIGARAAIPFGKKFTGIIRGDVGGFDIGGTNTTWQAAGYVNYAFGKGWSGTVGYREIYVNYKASEFAGVRLRHDTTSVRCSRSRYTF